MLDVKFQIAPDTCASGVEMRFDKQFGTLQNSHLALECEWVTAYLCCEVLGITERLERPCVCV